jgi:hypothetical protein
MRNGVGTGLRPMCDGTVLAAKALQRGGDGAEPVPVGSYGNGFPPVLPRISPLVKLEASEARRT